jgi:DNA primase
LARLARAYDDLVPRIKDTDIVLVRERTRIDEVIREVVTLKPAGGGSLKGLCPFHDERSPSFHVTPAKGYFHCFGCQEGGDAIDFVRKIDHLSFAEAVEKLAARTGTTLRYEEGGSAKPDLLKGVRTRLAEAHKAAAAFFAEQLLTPEAQIGRTFLTERDFDSAAAERFGVGFAPVGWDGLTKHLRANGFTDQELTMGGLAVAGKRGPYDRFRGRLVWPIRDLSGDVVGFGARRLREDDEGPKYLNTPETPLYKKSNVLYGVDLARKEISRRQQAVIVEGYTDVMAAHLAGVQTAVATCGTAFGVDHIKILRRLLMDQDEFRGQVIFTFDGDAAGKKAALKAFNEDQRFVTQTFVALDPNGMDPCDIRLKEGPEAVRDLIAKRIPMFEFAIRATLADYDLETAEGRVAGLRAAAPMLASIRDQALRPEYTRLVAGWLGIEPGEVLEAVRRAKPMVGAGTSSAPQRTQRRESSRRVDTEVLEPPPSQESAASKWERPARDSTATTVEREALKCAIQIPQHVDTWYTSVELQAFTWDVHGAVHQAMASAGSPGAVADGREWIEAVLVHCPDDAVRGYVRDFAVDPLHTEYDDDEGLRDYGSAVIARLLEMDATRRTVELKGRLQRTNPVENEAEYNKLFADLLALEQYRRQLRELALGGE